MTGAASRRLLLLLALALLIWSAAVLATGGVVVETPWGRLSSRTAIRPFAASVLLAAIYLARWQACWRADLGAAAALATPRVAAAAASILALVGGLAYGTWIAGGPDASGYVSQAAMLARAELTLPTPGWALEGTWANAEWSGAPVGYRPAQGSDRLAPTYPPGLPLLMALFLVGGGPAAVFWVVPLTGAVAVWATYRLGARLGGPAAGAVAAVLLLVSPPFLEMVTQPMSDVPATAFWALALVAALDNRSLAAGAAGAVALLIRPNLAPLAAVPAALLALEPGGRPTRLAIFGAAVAAAAIAFAALNAFYFGSPLQSGYGSLQDLYDAGRIGPNLLRYGWWLLLTETPLVLIGLAAPWSARTPPERTRAWLVAVVWPVATLALYLPYFAFDEWFYLRFLLPGYAGLFAGLGMVVVRRGVRARIAAAIVACCSLAFAVAAGALGNYAEHRRFARSVAYVESLPGDPVILSNGYSGTLHYYTGRDVLRFEVLDGPAMNDAIADLARRGRDVYFVGDRFEFEQIDELLRASPAIAPLDRAPRFDLGGVLVYRLIARD